jgi:hypothetical protein
MPRVDSFLILMQNLCVSCPFRLFQLLYDVYCLYVQIGNDVHQLYVCLCVVYALACRFYL